MPVSRAKLFQTLISPQRTDCLAAEEDRSFYIDAKKLVVSIPRISNAKIFYSNGFILNFESCFDAFFPSLS